MPVFEENVSLSESVLWALQKEFYDQKGENFSDVLMLQELMGCLGMKAWGEKIVPNYITTNPYIARGYARVYFVWFIN